MEKDTDVTYLLTNKLKKEEFYTLDEAKEIVKKKNLELIEKIKSNL